MKKIIFLLSLFSLLYPTTFVRSEEINLDNNNNRIPKCCERTKDQTRPKVTECRYSILSCESLNSAKITATGGYDYIQKDGLCLSSTGEIKEQSSDFVSGVCNNSQVSSSQITNNLDKVAIYAGYDQKQKNQNAIPLFIGNIINIALGLTGLIFLIFTVYSAIQWMTAGGNAEKVSKAKKRLIQTVIGIAITSIAYAAANLIISIIASAS